MKKFILTLIVLITISCSQSDPINGIFICETMKDSADYQNSFCFYQKLEFLNSSEALGKLNLKSGTMILKEVFFQAKRPKPTVC